MLKSIIRVEDANMNGPFDHLEFTDEEGNYFHNGNDYPVMRILTKGLRELMCDIEDIKAGCSHGCSILAWFGMFLSKLKENEYNINIYLVDASKVYSSKDESILDLVYLESCRSIDHHEQCVVPLSKEQLIKSIAL